MWGAEVEGDGCDDTGSDDEDEETLVGVTGNDEVGCDKGEWTPVGVTEDDDVGCDEGERTPVDTDVLTPTSTTADEDKC